MIKQVKPMIIYRVIDSVSHKIQRSGFDYRAKLVSTVVRTIEIMTNSMYYALGNRVRGA